MYIYNIYSIYVLCHDFGGWWHNVMFDQIYLAKWGVRPIGPTKCPYFLNKNRELKRKDDNLGSPSNSG